MSTTNPSSPDYIPQNVHAEPIRKSIKKFEPVSDDKPYWFECPKCGAGTFGIERDIKTFKLKRQCRCTLCGQRFIFDDLDAIFDDEIEESNDKKTLKFGLRWADLYEIAELHNMNHAEITTVVEKLFNDNFPKCKTKIEWMD